MKENWDHYDSGGGRYLQPEPLLQDPPHVRRKALTGFAALVYPYSQNNPLRFWDSTGLDIEVDVRSCGEAVKKAVDRLKESLNEAAKKSPDCKCKRIFDKEGLTEKIIGDTMFYMNCVNDKIVDPETKKDLKACGQTWMDLANQNSNEFTVSLRKACGAAIKTVAHEMKHARGPSHADPNKVEEIYKKIEGCVNPDGSLDTAQE